MSTPNNKITTAEYTHTLTEAQNRLKALTASFAKFIDEHKEPDIQRLNCVIDDVDRLDETIRQLYQLTKNIKAYQQLEPAQSTQNQTDHADDPRGFDPNYTHHDMCEDGQDVSGFVESISRNGFMAGGIINLNRRAYIAEGDSKRNRDDAYYSMLSVKMVFEDTRELTRAWIHSVNKGDGSLYSKTEADTLALIDEITSRAIDVLSEFTNVLAGVEPITNTQIIGVFDSISGGIANIEDVVRAYETFSRNRPA
ncbi:MAG: hypothetical protein WC504_01440 [Methylobacter sp.]|jgi:hypothetical protein